MSVFKIKKVWRSDHRGDCINCGYPDYLDKNDCCKKCHDQNACLEIEDKVVCSICGKVMKNCRCEVKQ